MHNAVNIFQNIDKLTYWLLFVLPFCHRKKKIIDIKDYIIYVICIHNVLSLKCYKLGLVIYTIYIIIEIEDKKNKWVIPHEVIQVMILTTSDFNETWYFVSFLIDMKEYTFFFIGILNPKAGHKRIKS